MNQNRIEKFNSISWAKFGISNFEASFRKKKNLFSGFARKGGRWESPPFSSPDTLIKILILLEHDIWWYLMAGMRGSRGGSIQKHSFNPSEHFGEDSPLGRLDTWRQHPPWSQRQHPRRIQSTIGRRIESAGLPCWCLEGFSVKMIL